METVRKQTRTQADPVEGELAAINALGNTSLTAEEVYPFGVRLCDNQTDRDLEYFARADLEQLAALFVGKTGIFDHSWSAKDQRARIYRTELVEEPGVVTEAGEPGCYLKGYAYMLRTAENAGLIAEIEGGSRRRSASAARCAGRCAPSAAMTSMTGASAATGRDRSMGRNGASCAWQSPRTPLNGPSWRCLPSPGQGW